MLEADWQARRDGWQADQTTPASRRRWRGRGFRAHSRRVTSKLFDLLLIIFHGSGDLVRRLVLGGRLDRIQYFAVGIADDDRPPGVIGHSPCYRQCLFSVGPGDCSQSLIRDAVSACRARRRSNSRDRLPSGFFSAASLNFLASCASRSSKLSVCLTRGRNLTWQTPFKTCPSGMLILRLQSGLSGG